MLDAEVEFELERQAWNAPKTLDRSLSAIVGTAGLGLGFWAARQIGWENIGGTLVGASSGATLLLYLKRQGRICIENILTGRYTLRENEKDAEIRESGAPAMALDYRGNQVLCVIRPEHGDNDRIYKIRIVDDLLRNATFAYEPKNTQNPLQFSFSAGIKTPSGFMTPSKNQIDYIERIGELVKTESDLHVRFEITPLEINTFLTYQGENYEKELPRFSRVANKLMGTAYSLRALANHRSA